MLNPICKPNCLDCGTRYCRLPTGLDGQELALLNTLSKRHINIKRGDYLYRQGQPAQMFYVVTAGTLKSVMLSENGDEAIVGFYFMGDMLGLESLHNHAHLTSAIGLADSQVCEINLESLLDINAKLPKLQRTLLDLISAQLGQQIAGNSKRTALQNLVAFLLTMGNRLGQPYNNTIEFELIMARYDIANYLHLTIETISRLLTRLQIAKLISVQRNHIKLLDINQLQKIALGTINL